MSRIREIITHYGQQDTVTCCQRDMRCVHALIRDTVSLWLRLARLESYGLWRCYSAANELGLGENIAIKLNRGSRVSGRQERYTTDTDKQLELEMPSILNETDKLLSK